MPGHATGERRRECVDVTVFTYGRGLAGRQIPGQPLPDHGVQEYDQIHGGSYTKVHPEFYANSVMKDIRAPELGDFDILADVTPAAKKRGMQTYALFEEAYNPRLIANFERIAEVDIYGRVGRDTCFNNPDARNFLTAMVEDWVKSNDLDGLMWESERQGPLNDTIGAHFGRFNGTSFISCFCTHCVQKASEQGINVARAREGYLALDQWVKRTYEPAEGERRLICHAVATVAGISRDTGLGKVLVQEPGGSLRPDLRHREGSESEGASGLAHHASGYDEPVLPGGAGLFEAGARLGLSSSRARITIAPDRAWRSTSRTFSPRFSATRRRTKCWSFITR